LVVGVGEARTKGEVVVVGVLVAERFGAPSVPVQRDPWAQHPTTRFMSAEQIAVEGQQRPGALSAAQA
jgi:hypothetical protein